MSLDVCVQVQYTGAGGSGGAPENQGESMVRQLQATQQPTDEALQAGRIRLFTGGRTISGREAERRDADEDDEDGDDEEDGDEDDDEDDEEDGGDGGSDWSDEDGDEGDDEEDGDGKWNGMQICT